MTRAAADTDEKHPAAILSNVRDEAGKSLDGFYVEPTDNFHRLFEVPG